jgi:hypothetical protein
VVAVTDVSALDYDDLAVLAEVDRFVKKVFEVAGPDVPKLSDPAWLTAPPAAKIASLLVLAEAYLVTDPHLIAAEMIKDVSVAISSSRTWSAASLPSHAELVRRRAEPGPVHAPFDPVAAARWVETGSSGEETAA